MKRYWPMAIVLDGKIPIQLHTYDSCDSIKEAEKVFKCWQDSGYKLLSTWIQSGKSYRIIKHKSYVNAFGKLEKIEC